MKKRILKKKLKKANNIVKNYVRSNYNRGSWKYIDFVEDDRFLNEIMDEKEINIHKASYEELAEFAIEKISEPNVLDFGQYIL